MYWIVTHRHKKKMLAEDEVEKDYEESEYSREMEGERCRLWLQTKFTSAVLLRLRIEKTGINKSFMYTKTHRAWLTKKPRH